MILHLPQSMWPRQFGDWTRAWSTAEGAEALRIVLPPASFVSPCLVAPLAAGIASRRARSLPTTFLGEDPDSLRYLQRIDFFRALDITVEEGFDRHETASLVPLQRITSTAVARSLSGALGDFLEGQLGEGSSSVLRFARFVFEELGANVVQHSRASETGFGLAQAWRASSRFQFAFADAGVGFLASLQENREFTGRIADDGEALQIALEGGVSRRGAGNIGMGLSLLKELTDRLGGELFLASGEALLHRRTIATGARASSVSKIAPWQGAWICVEATLPTA